MGAIAPNSFLNVSENNPPTENSLFTNAIGTRCASTPSQDAAFAATSFSWSHQLCTLTTGFSHGC